MKAGSAVKHPGNSGIEMQSKKSIFIYTCVLLQREMRITENYREQGVENISKAGN